MFFFRWKTTEVLDFADRWRLHHQFFASDNVDDEVVDGDDDDEVLATLNFPGRDFVAF